MNSLIV